MTRQELLERIKRIPIIDVHSHMNRTQMAAKDIQMVIGYHMLRYPLNAAGADMSVVWPADRALDVDAYRQAFAEYWPRIANTGFARMLRDTFAELYDFTEPIGPDSLGRMIQAFEKNNSQPDWPRQVLDKANCVRILSSSYRVPPLEPGADDFGVRFTVEAPGFSMSREMPEWSGRLGKLGELIDQPTITNRQQLHDATAAYYQQFDWAEKGASVLWVGGLADLTPVPDDLADDLLQRAGRDEHLTVAETATLEGIMIRATVKGFAPHNDMFQLVYGTQFLTAPSGRPVTRAHPLFASSIAHLAGEFPDMRFNILSGVELDEPTWCSMCLAYPNVSLGGFWWSGFYSTHMINAWHRRLDMVPVSSLCGFFSDGFCVDWVFARIRQTQQCLAHVLSEKIDRGEYTIDQALQVARDLLFESPRRLFLPNENINPA
jgi:glucuronate isomerase